jgi:hypothetical protein
MKTSSPEEIAVMNSNLRDAVDHYLDQGITLQSLADDTGLSITRLRDFLVNPNEPGRGLSFNEGYRLGQSLGTLIRAEEQDREEMPEGKLRKRMVTGADLWMGAKSSQPVRDPNVRHFTLEDGELIEE